MPHMNVAEYVAATYSVLLRSSRSSSNVLWKAIIKIRRTGSICLMKNIENGKFQKSDEEIKLHIRMNLPEEIYSEVITSFRDYSTMTLRQVKKDIRSFYRRMKRAEKIKDKI